MGGSCSNFVNRRLFSLRIREIGGENLSAT
jgi:hypothetical protein